MSSDIPAPEAIRAALERIVTSPQLESSPSLCRFLRYVVEETLAGRGGQIKEYSLGAEVFARGDDFDPRIDPIVRVQARNLRARMAKYYEGPGADDAVSDRSAQAHLRSGVYIQEAPGATQPAPARKSCRRRAASRAAKLAARRPRSRPAPPLDARRAGQKTPVRVVAAAILVAVAGGALSWPIKPAHYETARTRSASAGSVYPRPFPDGPAQRKGASRAASSASSAPSRRTRDSPPLTPAWRTPTTSSRSTDTCCPPRAWRRPAPPPNTRSSSIPISPKDTSRSPPLSKRTTGTGPRRNASTAAPSHLNPGAAGRAPLVRHVPARPGPPRRGAAGTAARRAACAGLGNDQRQSRLRAHVQGQLQLGPGTGGARRGVEPRLRSRRSCCSPTPIAAWRAKPKRKPRSRAPSRRPGTIRTASPRWPGPTRATAPTRRARC